MAFPAVLFMYCDELEGIEGAVVAHQTAHQKQDIWEVWTDLIGYTVVTLDFIVAVWSMHTCMYIHA